MHRPDMLFCRRSYLIWVIIVMQRFKHSYVGKKDTHSAHSDIVMFFPRLPDLTLGRLPCPSLAAGNVSQTEIALGGVGC